MNEVFGIFREAAPYLLTAACVAALWVMRERLHMKAATRIEIQKDRRQATENLCEAAESLFTVIRVYPAKDSQRPDDSGDPQPIEEHLLHRLADYSRARAGAAVLASDDLNEVCLKLDKLLSSCLPGSIEDTEDRNAALRDLNTNYGEIRSRLFEQARKDLS